MATKSAGNIDKEIIIKLRQVLREVTLSEAALKNQLAAREHVNARLEAASYGSAQCVEALYMAVRILANGVDSTTARGKTIRSEVREIIERVGITPPSTLGSSRRTGGRRKKRKLDRKTVGTS